MKCDSDNCNRDAKMHLTQIINGEKIVLNLCEECAAKKGFHSPLDNIPFPLANFLAEMMDQEPSGKGRQALADPDLTCDNCGLTFQEFSQLGRFGCGQCYQTFRGRLQGLLRKIHGSSLHRGKLPPTLSEDGTIIKEKERLLEELQRAITDEDYERAADLRDKIKTLEKAAQAEEEAKERENV